MNKIKKFLLAWCVMFSFASSQDTIRTKSSDELFSLARTLAFSGKRTEARELLNLALSKSPNYADIRIFLGRVLSWDGMRAEAREHFQLVLALKPDYVDALNASIDNELWDDKPFDALKLCNQALKYHPNNEDFLVKKARALKELNREEEALFVVARLEDVNRSNPNIAALREAMKMKKIVNSISVTYNYDYYSRTYAPSHSAYLQYGRSLSFGSVFGRINYSNRFGKNGAQIEADAYPRIMDGVYSFLNYGYSFTSLFPKHRAGAELFASLPASLEASAGFRYLYFVASSDVTILTASLGYYFRDYWFSLRTYITPSNVSFSRSLSFTTRYYLEAEEYYSFKIGAGFSPDERISDSVSANIYFLKAQTIGIGWQKPLGNYSLINLSFDWTNQELVFAKGEFVKLYSLSLAYKYKF